MKKKLLFVSLFLINMLVISSCTDLSPKEISSKTNFCETKKVLTVITEDQVSNYNACIDWSDTVGGGTLHDCASQGDGTSDCIDTGISCGCPSGQQACVT